MIVGDAWAHAVREKGFKDGEQGRPKSTLLADKKIYLDAYEHGRQAAEKHGRAGPPAGGADGKRRAARP